MNRFLHRFNRWAVCTLLTAVSVDAMAQVNVLKDGYYRIQNKKSAHYVYLMDNKGEINEVSTSADVGACRTWKLDKRDPFSDPASVIYVRSINGSGYALEAQGASSWDFVQYAIQCLKVGEYYRCYATKSGVTLYISNTYFSRAGNGYLSTVNTDKLDDSSLFSVVPMNTTDNYIGVKPTVSLGGKHYAPYYVSYPFSFVSTGMKAYTVTRVENGKALLKPVTSSVIPAKTPVIIECSSTEASDNRLKIEASAPSISGNLLSGNFFYYEGEGDGDKHRNVTSWNKNTMRTLGITAEGKLGFVAPTDDFIPANHAFYASSTALTGNITLVTDESEFVTFIKGDANGDGKVSVVDITAIINIMTGKSQPSYNKDAADANGDGKVSVADITAVINIMTKK